MSQPPTEKATPRELLCGVCHKRFSRRELVPAAGIREAIADRIRHDNPNWNAEGYVCVGDLSRYRAHYVEFLLESEKGDLTTLEREVIESLRQHEILTTDVEAEFAQELTPGERLADRMASFGGSWTFLITFAAVLALWIGINSMALLRRPFDPYPYILLNLLLSCLAAIQAPIIMMSQNRQETKDRIRSQHDYQVNLKAELEIRHLHEKIDHLLSQQWERLVEIQQSWIELLSRLLKASHELRQWLEREIYSAKHKPLGTESEIRSATISARHTNAQRRPVPAAVLGLGPSLAISGSRFLFGRITEPCFPRSACSPMTCDASIVPAQKYPTYFLPFVAPCS